MSPQADGFSDLLHEWFSFPSLVHVHVGAILSPLRVESGKQPPSPPPYFGTNEAAGSAGGPPSPGRGVLLPRPWRPSSWAPSLCRCARRPLRGPHRRCHNLAPGLDARLHGRHLLAGTRGVRRAAPITADIVLMPMRPPSSTGSPPPLRKRFLAELLLREFSSPALAPIFVDGI